MCETMINVDISNIWGEVSLPDLLGIEKETSEAHMGLTEGNGFSDWMDIPVDVSAEKIDMVLAAAERIRKDSDILVVVGLGSACTGAKAVIDLLQGLNRNLGKGKADPQIFFAGNSLSTRAYGELKRLLEGKDFSLCVVSQTGTMLESDIAVRNLRWMLERKYGTDEAETRLYGADGEKTDVLLPMAVAGIDILELIRGAEEAKENYDLRSFENPVWLYGAVRNLLYRGGKKIEILESFEPEFQTMGRWWQQLFAGSEGKEGKGIFPATAELTADLHSLGRLIQQGERNIFETVIRFDAPENRTVVGEDVKNRDGLNYIAGKSLDFVEEMACRSMVEAHVDGGIPVITIDCGELCERTVGELLYFFQLSCALSACILGVKPFEGTGTEAYERNMFDLLGKPGDNEE